MSDCEAPLNFSSSLSVVIPVFNTAPDTLRELVQRLRLSLAGLSLEIILVDDGAQDECWETIVSLHQQFPDVTGLRLSRNFGQHNALLCGVRAARHEWIVTMDDDLQHFPEQIHVLMNETSRGVDVVYGVPETEQHGLWRDMASLFIKGLLKHAMQTSVATQVSSFRLFRTTLRESFSEFNHPLVNMDVLLSWATVRFGSVRVPHGQRIAGTSQYTFSRLMIHALNLITGFSSAPLRITGWLGFGFSFFGLLIFLYVVVRYLLFGSPVKGFPFLASIIAIFSGIQLFALGIIGEYLARVHVRLMGRPVYSVKQELRSGPP